MKRFDYTVRCIYPNKRNRCRKRYGNDGVLLKRVLTMRTFYIIGGLNPREKNINPNSFCDRLRPIIRFRSSRIIPRRRAA